MGFPGGSAGKESTCNAGDLGSIPGWEDSPGEGKGYLLQYSGLENSIDCVVHGVAKSQTQLNDFHFQSGYTQNSEKAMAPHSSTLAWKIPWMEEPGIYTNNEKTEREIKETIPFTTAAKRIKYLGVNLKR